MYIPKTLVALACLVLVCVGVKLLGAGWLVTVLVGVIALLLCGVGLLLSCFPRFGR